MRWLVITLALMAGAKVWFQDTLFRSGAEQALVSAYRHEAIKACKRQPQRDAHGRTLAAFLVDWAHPSSVTLSAGNRNLPVYLWNVDDPRWNARFKNPHLVLASGDIHSGLVCTFDILTGETNLARL